MEHNFRNFFTKTYFWDTFSRKDLCGQNKLGLDKMFETVVSSFGATCIRQKLFRGNFSRRKVFATFFK